MEKTVTIEINEYNRLVENNLALNRLANKLSEYCVTYESTLVDAIDNLVRQRDFYKRHAQELLVDIITITKNNINTPESKNTYFSDEEPPF